MATSKNPFILTDYCGPEYFCDREQETEALIEHLQGGLSTVLLSVRRLGKTDLIKHVQHKLQNDMLCIYIDILATETIQDFLSALSTAMINAIPEKSSFGEKIWKIVKSLRPVFSFDSMTGEPKVSFDVNRVEAENHIDNLFSYLNGYNKKVFIAIDEFQQISNYPEKNTDAYLRSKIQQYGNIVFIFSGSQQHIISEMFAMPNKPFYRSATFLKLGKINRDKYKLFISSHFTKAAMHIPDKVIDEILDWANVHTYYVQILCNRIFTNGEKNIDTELWRYHAARILKEHEFIFVNYRNMLTNNQWQLLKAIALEGKVYEPTSKAFVGTHDLGSPASVLRSLHALQKIEQIIQESDENGNNFYMLNDLLLQRWIDKR